MPASDLMWNASQGQCYPVFGTKRKSCHNQETALPDIDMGPGGDCKRRCINQREHEPVEINHNDPQWNSLHQVQPYTQIQPQPVQQPMMEQNQFLQPQSQQPPCHYVSVQQYYGGPQYHSVSHNPQSLDQYPAHKTAETNMVMDLCDETYTVLPVKSEPERQMEAAEQQMESDFAPNPQQYRNSTFAYCDPNCVGEQGSPGSRVRSYCKPTWDGLMDVRPYVSDYY